ncbi:transcriptional regulator [uncultured Mediterranean phage uvMED]|nr:transcriptional regulator [uncultured Mediterranean phage uvMED]
MNVNLKRIAQEKGLVKSMGIQLSRISGIDKSTVSAHLTGVKKLSMYHAKKYAEGLDVPIIKLLDESVVKYNVGAYVEPDGSVRLRKENENSVIISEIHNSNSGELSIYEEANNIVYFYNPLVECKYDCTRCYCYIKTKNKSFLGDVIVSNKKTKICETMNRHTFEKKKLKIIQAHPITSIHFIKHTNIFKVQDSL